MLKLYKKIIVWSAIIMIGAIILSIISESVGLSSLISNYAIGIACSLFVVILTTSLQFITEEKKLESKLLLETNQVLFYMQVIICGFQEGGFNLGQIRIIYKAVEKYIIESAELAGEMSWFLPSKKKKCIELWLAIAHIEFLFVSNDILGQKEAIESLSNYDSFFALLDAAFNFHKNEQEKTKLLELRKEIEDIQKNGQTVKERTEVSPCPTSPPTSPTPN